MSNTVWLLIGAVLALLIIFMMRNNKQDEDRADYLESSNHKDGKIFEFGTKYKLCVNNFNSCNDIQHD